MRVVTSTFRWGLPANISILLNASMAWPMNWVISGPALLTDLIFPWTKYICKRMIPVWFVLFTLYRHFQMSSLFKGWGSADRQLPDLRPIDLPSSPNLHWFTRPFCYKIQCSSPPVCSNFLIIFGEQWFDRPRLLLLGHPTIFWWILATTSWIILICLFITARWI